MARARRSWSRCGSTRHVTTDRPAGSPRRSVNSALVKTVGHGVDPNWGRVVMAIGKCSDDTDIDEYRVSIRFGVRGVPRTILADDGCAELEVLPRRRRGAHLVGLGIADGSLHRLRLRSDRRLRPHQPSGRLCQVPLPESASWVGIERRVPGMRHRLGCGSWWCAVIGVLAVSANASRSDGLRTARRDVRPDDHDQRQVLRADLACAGDGLIITASNVTVWLGGHTISSTDGAGTGIRFGVALTSDAPPTCVHDVALRGGRISGSPAGLLWLLRRQRQPGVGPGSRGQHVGRPPAGRAPLGRPHHDRGTQRHRGPLRPGAADPEACTCRSRSR